MPLGFFNTDISDSDTVMNTRCHLLMFPLVEWQTSCFLLKFVCLFAMISNDKLRNSRCPVPHVVKMSKVAMESNDKVDILQLNNFGNCEA